jgi:archaellum component FlaC
LSPLSKTFVVLLVLLSLLLTAATVVFVNQVDNYRGAAKLADEKLKAAERTRDAAVADAGAARATAEAATNKLAGQVEQAKQQMNEVQRAQVEKDVQLGQAKSSLAVQAADLTRMAEALKASEDTKSQLSKQVGDQRESLDKFMMQNASLNQSVTDLTNKLEVMTREFKFVSEQLAEQKNQTEKAQSMLRDAGITPQMAAAGIRGPSAPAINGVIRAVKPIGGFKYGIISVGSADGVVKGLEFKVVDRNTGAFLGILTVDTVELNESTGRLTGPKVDDIRTNAEVKTQL